jgi:ribosomal protein L16/L10AE
MRALAVLAVVLLALGGCKQSKEDLLLKVQDVKTRSELESRLGRPKKIKKAGQVETWTYKVARGKVVFTVVGDTVTLQTAAGGDKKK